jgi:dephospho-CoA kinase
VIGLTGGIGSGKSSAAARLAELGAFVIDADKVGHALLTQRPIRELLVDRFGPGILGEATRPEPAPVESSIVPERAEAGIDRRALAAIVFDDPGARKALEEILHPRMRQTFAKAIGRTIRRGQHKAVVLDAAILHEAGWDGLCDRVIFIDAPRDLRLSRLASQRGWDAETLLSRENAQSPLEEKRDRADGIVANIYGLDALHEEIDRAWASLLASAPSRAIRASKPDRIPSTRSGSSPRPPGRSRLR